MMKQEVPRSVEASTQQCGIKYDHFRQHHKDK